MSPSNVYPMNNKYNKHPIITWKYLLHVNSVRGTTFVLVNINMSLRKGIHQTIQLMSLKLERWRIHVLKHTYLKI